MALQALHAAASGMHAYQTNLDVIANNLANAGTTGFKRSRVDFEDLYYQTIRAPGTTDANNLITPIGIQIGLGVQVSGTSVEHTQGNLLQTERPLDVAIRGEGFFQVQDNNNFLYTRAGAFAINAEGQLVVESAGRGRLIEPNILIPTEAEDISVGADGTISYTEGAIRTTVGPIETARFVNPQGLIQRGENMYAVSDASGPPVTGIPGDEGRGSLISGYLESSNVEPVRELVDLIKTQRNFELNSQVVQAADQALQLIANLRRS